MHEQDGAPTRSSRGGASSSSEAGLPPAGRRGLARDARYDLHALLELVERGCPPELAVRIVAPLERRRRGMSTVTLPVSMPWSPTRAAARPRCDAPRRGVAGLATRPSRRRRRAGRGDRAAARAAPPRRALRGRSPARDAAPPPRRRARRHRPPGGRRRADERAAAPRRLPRREPLHDVGLQVRPARGGGQAPQARLAGPRDPARARDLEPVRERAARARRRGRAERAPRRGRARRSPRS